MEIQSKFSAKKRRKIKHQEQAYNTSIYAVFTGFNNC